MNHDRSNAPATWHGQILPTPGWTETLCLLALLLLTCVFFLALS